MNFWHWLFGEDVPPVTGDTHKAIVTMTTNPSTGLPMAGECGGVDVGGNPFGMDLHQSGCTSSSDCGGSFEIGTSFGNDWFA